MKTPNRTAPKNPALDAAKSRADELDREDMPHGPAPSKATATAADNAEAAKAEAEGVSMLCVGLAKLLGDIGTRVGRVSPLTDDEVTSLGDAATKVALSYDLSKMHPRTAALIVLGVTVLGIVAPRVGEVMDRRLVDVTPPKAATEERPAGVTDSRDTSNDNGGSVVA